MKNKWLLVVSGTDRPGIIANVTEVLYRAESNLEDVTMTILEGVLSMILVVTVKSEKKAGLDHALKKLGQKSDLTFGWRQLPRAKKASAKKSEDLYLISAVGRDRTGIVYEISREMARRGLNIQDLNSRILGSGPKAVYAMVLEVAVPENYKVKSLRDSLEKLGAKLKVDVTLKPVELLQF
jgi:glycine cleavage system transcriptional repressor